MAKFEKRFAGKDNAGLRAEIRETAKHAVEENRNVRTAIVAIARRVALSANGRATLELVADDYANQG